jgi:hypothetical protein
MLHRHHGAIRLHSHGESRKYLEVFIWMLIGLVVYVMIRFVLADVLKFSRMPMAPEAPIWAHPPVAVVEAAASQ